MDGLVACINGKLVPLNEAKTSSLDFGFLYGVGLFEALRTWKGMIFALEKHIQRLFNGISELGWEVPINADELTQWVCQTICANYCHIERSNDLRLRITVTPGTVDMRRGWWDFSGCEPTIVIHAVPLPRNFDEQIEHGWTATFAPWHRHKDLPLLQLKSSSYFANIIAKRWAKANGFDEAIWLNTDGNLTEGTSTNIFFVNNGEILTPPPSEGLLPGIARKIVMELAEEMGIKAKECPVPSNFVEIADEAFLTNAVIGVVPVRQLAHRKLANMTLTKQIRGAYISNAVRLGCKV